tara:strand:- start:31 stop:1227 length:1197 start_codon:yes stop_codon:yes gene_type:complete
MIQFQIINSLKTYILTKHSHYYTIDEYIKDGGLYIKCDKTSLSEHIGDINDYKVELDESKCKSLGVSYKDDKFYLMNLFIYAKHDNLKIGYDRKMLFEYFEESSNIDMCVYDDNTPLYILYDKVIVYGINYKDHIITKFDISYISNENILIIEDACDILHNTRIKNIYNDIERFNINHIIILHSNKTIYKEYCKLKTDNIVQSVTYYPYPVHLDYKAQQLVKYEKIYDILLFGSIRMKDDEECYSFRSRLYYILKDNIFTKLKNIRIKIIDHPDNTTIENRSYIIGNDLIRMFKQSKFVICTSSRFNLLLRKYVEVNCSNTYIIGKNPFKIVPTDSIIIIEPTMSNETIISRFIDAVEKYDTLKDNVTPILDGKLTHCNFYNDIINRTFIEKYNYLVE